MSNIESFQSFHLRNMGIDYEDLFSLQENKSQAKYSFEGFKNYFSGLLLESDGYIDESLLEDSFAFYEYTMLYEAKSHWFESESMNKAMYLDCDSHMMIFTEGEGFLIEKRTFTKINEWLTMDDIGKAWNSLKSKTKSAVDNIKSVAGKTWDSISYGAKKAWEFVKMCANAVADFVKGMTFLEWAALGLSLLSAVLGIAGAATTAVGVGPALTAIGGVCQGISGGIHIYEGVHKYNGAIKIFGKSGITPQAKLYSAISIALPEVLTGGVLIALGINDVVQSATGLVDPSSGSRSVATSTSSKITLKSFIKSISKPGHAIEHAIHGLAEGALKKAGIEVSKVAGEGVARVATTVFATIAPAIMSKLFGWLFEFMLKAGKTVTKGFDYLINIPSKISSAIASFQKNADSTLTKILSTGLGKIVKPMTDGASSIIKKYVQPNVNFAKIWIDLQIKGYNENKKILEEYKHELHTGIKHEHKKEDKVKPIFKLEKKTDVPKSDVDKLNKLNDKSKNQDKSKKAKVKGKVKESQVWEMKYIKGFDNLNFI
jgi:hypothetical protein